VSPSTAWPHPFFLHHQTPDRRVNAPSPFMLRKEVAVVAAAAATAAAAAAVVVVPLCLLFDSIHGTGDGLLG